MILKKLLTRFDFTQFWDSRDPKHVHAHSARFVLVGSVCAPALHGSDAGKEQRLHASSGAKCLLAEMHAARLQDGDVPELGREQQELVGLIPGPSVLVLPLRVTKKECTRVGLG